MMDDSTCIRLLSASFSKQLQWYEELSRIVQRTLSQLVLSRGDVRSVMASVLEKRKIVDMIAREREKIRETANFYRQRKDQIQSSLLKNDLDRLLAKSESAIKEFLDAEDQLKRYLEFIMVKSEGVTR
jgi:hypothetical protein